MLFYKKNHALIAAQSEDLRNWVSHDRTTIVIVNVVLPSFAHFAKSSRIFLLRNESVAFHSNDKLLPPPVLPIVKKRNTIKKLKIQLATF